MRILILNHEFPPLGGGGGRVSYELGRHLVQSGHAVTVVTTNDGRKLPRQETVAGMEIHRVYGKRRSPLDNNVPITMASYLAGGTRLALKLLRQSPFDVIHAFFTLPAGLVGVWLKSRTGLPLIVSPHGSDVPYHNPDEFNLPIRMLAPVISRIWKRSDRVTTVSDGLRKTAQRTAPKIDFQVVHNGIDLDRFKPTDTLPENPIPQLICAARLVQLKGIHHLLEALSQLKQSGRPFHLKIAGDGNIRSDLESLRLSLKLEDYVTFLGHVPHDRLPALYHQADAFVLPSLNESFGQVFAEAMACGLPVIGSTAGGIPEVVGPHQHPFLVQPGDTDALARKLISLLQSSNQRNRLGEQNIAYIRKHFNWTRISDIYAGIYAGVCRPSQSHSPDYSLNSTSSDKVQDGLQYPIRRKCYLP